MEEKGEVPERGECGKEEILFTFMAHDKTRKSLQTPEFLSF